MRLSSVAATCLGLVAAAGGAYVATTSFGPSLLAGAGAVAAIVGVRVWGRVPVVPLAVLTCFAGYVLFNRSFAGLRIPAGPLPLYIGELLLLIALPWAVWRWPGGTSGDIRRFLVVLGIWLTYAFARLLAGGLAYGIDALRDFAIAYYGLFTVVGYVVWARLPRSTSSLFFAMLFATLVPVVVIVAITGEFELPFSNQDTTDQGGANRADVMADALIAGATFFLLPLRRARLHFIRLAISSASLVLLLPLEVRSATVSALAVFGVFAWQRRWATLASLVGMPILVYGLLTLTGVQFSGRSGNTSPEAIANRQLATISALVGGEAADAAAAGALYTQNDVVDTVAWRLVWWKALMGELTSSEVKTVFGLGFGADLTAPLGYQPGDPNVPPVRSPHNFLLTLFARTGLIGLALWLAMLGAWAVPLLRGMRSAMRRRDGEDSDYLLWLMTYPLAIVVSAVFGVVLEGPYGAIPCYLVMGMGLRAATDVARAHNPGHRALPPDHVGWSPSQRGRVAVRARV
jgi:hypothetical protein